MRAGPAAQAYRVGLAQRRWRLDPNDDADAEALFASAGLPPRMPFFTRNMMHDGIVANAPLYNSQLLAAAPTTPISKMSIPPIWLGNKRWFQVSK